jgi:hypothetical protein
MKMEEKKSKNTCAVVTTMLNKTTEKTLHTQEADATKT